ncbi:pectin degradation repressor protein KdgR [Thermoclostridium stercorarium subsp. stercorarium DSM 8532]|jgi:IclR family KDG regulon transcriptional repressor|uniref:Glycerol operon regulatory protein n=3 Tax=Thermoclostridium stercorarium TaxID=1510 RepID=L7VME6_THES1|nr:IclR family transcriptional regulator [Thermoclostridium stercorarium]AGC67819.1 pectin degradation repressor protein KdgR [Thermoclostridium stercorarium subsp. stercorarium DSM 8532]AGI38862.1 transcriptional regulator [Thermoclostridium stercorarium subsp. stercorarium DSM 8532]ANW98231.1 IclR family transcriptional regulator [Thermoclostridium stercorarium subsp. thermolacticum DSM 2910]ANX00762.1 IclR family transcriptional regulator [Thermoclostridium stercorarium subsp. leptospartum D
MAENGVQTLDRTFDIIELLAVTPNGMGVTEIGQKLGLHKSTVYRLINALVRRGYLEKDQNTGLYKIGPKFIEISGLYVRQIELKTEAAPFMRHLTELTGQVTHLAILDETEVVYIEKIEVMQSLRMYSQIGKRVPVHCSALGKVLLSGQNSDYQEQVLGKIKYIRYTENTVKDADEFKRELEMVRQKGWAIDNEEHEIGIRCIAAPVRDFTGKIIAALSITGSKNIISPDKDEYYGKLVVEAADNISRRLGFTGKTGE